MHLNRDCVILILRFIGPKTALSFRATNRHYNNVISHAQTYWFYQYKGLLGKTRRSDQESREISGKRSVHVKPMTQHCIRYRPGNLTVLHQLFEKYPGISFEHEALMKDKRHYDEFVVRMYVSNMGIGFSEEWLKQKYETEVTEQILLRHLTEVQTLSNVTCRTPGHCIIIYDDDPVVGLQRSTQGDIDTNGLYMYHYLIERFQLVKKIVQKVTPNDAAIEHMQLQIQIRKQQITALREQIWVMENHEMLTDDIKSCPFVRSRPNTYHKKVEHLFKAPTEAKPNKRAKR